MNESASTTLVWAQVIAVALALATLVIVLQFLGFVDVTARLFLMSLGVFATAPGTIGTLLGGIGGPTGAQLWFYLLILQALLDIVQFGIRVVLLRSDLLHIGFLIVNAAMIALSTGSVGIATVVRAEQSRATRLSTAARDATVPTAATIAAAALENTKRQNTIRVLGVTSAVSALATLLIVAPLAFAVLPSAAARSLLLLLFVTAHLLVGAYAALVNVASSATFGRLLCFLVVALVALDATHLGLRLSRGALSATVTLTGIVELLLLFICIAFLALSGTQLAASAWIWWPATSSMATSPAGEQSVAQRTAGGNSTTQGASGGGGGGGDGGGALAQLGNSVRQRRAKAANAP
jgi:hypothetical protein